MDGGGSTAPGRGGSNALVRGALQGAVIASACLAVVGLVEPFELGAGEAIVAFTVLPLLGAVTSRLAWQRERERGRVRPRRLVGLGLVALVALSAAGGALLSQPVASALRMVDRTAPSDDVVVQPVPGRPDVRIAVAGDTGTGTTHQWRTARTMFLQSQTRRYDALLLLGDLVYPSGDASLVRRVVTGPFSSLLTGGTELVPVLGNHDYQQGEQQQILAALDRRSPWYVERVGSVRVIALDSNRVSDAAQTLWLRKVLATPQPVGTWTIVAMHHPAYSAGAHGSELEVRRTWGELFARYEVPLVLSGHDHDYQRSAPQDGVTYVVSGAGAKVRAVGEEPFTAVSSAQLHYLDLLVYDERLVGRAVAQDGQLIDTFTIARAPAPG